MRRGSISTDTIDIKKIIKERSEQYHYFKFDNLDKME